MNDELYATDPVRQAERQRFRAAQEERDQVQRLQADKLAEQLRKWLADLTPENRLYFLDQLDFCRHCGNPPCGPGRYCPCTRDE